MLLRFFFVDSILSPKKSEYAVGNILSRCLCIMMKFSAILSNISFLRKYKGNDTFQKYLETFYNVCLFYVYDKKINSIRKIRYCNAIPKITKMAKIS